MPQIGANITLLRTVATLDAATLAEVLAWLKTNVTDKLQQNTTCAVTLTIQT